MEDQIENEEDDNLEDLFDDIYKRAEKYDIDYEHLKRTIEKKIEERGFDDISDFDWDNSQKNDRIEREKEEQLIQNIFESFRTCDKNGG